MSENMVMERNSKYVVRTGSVKDDTVQKPSKHLENVLNELSEEGFVPVNITQQFVPGKGWVYSLVAKR